MVSYRAAPLLGVLCGLLSACNAAEEKEPATGQSTEIECGTEGVLCYEFGEVDVPPGGEWQGFQAVDVGNTSEVAIVAMEIEQKGAVSHHFTVSLWNDAAPPQLGGPYDLFKPEGVAFVASALGATLIGSVFRYVRIDTGKYVGVTLPAGSFLVNNAHFVNTSDSPAVGRTSVRIRTVPREEVRFATKNALPGVMTIDVPPTETRTVTGSWIPPGDVAIVLLTSHMHRHGRLFEAWQTVSGVQTKVYSTTSYESPPLNFYSGTSGNPPIVLRPAAGDKMDFACTHENDDLNVSLTYGPYAMTSEMCVLPLYYLDEPDAFLDLLATASPDSGTGFSYEIIPNDGQ